MPKRFGWSSLGNPLRWISLLILSLATVWLEAQAHLTIERISREEGLSHPSILCLLKDRKGFLWVGTQYGLNRYDGYNFITYRRQLGRLDGLSDNFITSLCEDDEAFLWVGTQNGGLNRFNPHTLKFTSYLPEEEDPTSISHVDVRSIVTDQAKRIWVGTQVGLNRFVSDQVGFEIPGRDPVIRSFLEAVSVRALAVDPAGRLWIGSTNGLFCWNEDSQELKGFGLTDGLAHQDVTSLVFDDQGRLWLGTWGGGVQVMDPVAGEFLPELQKNVATGTLVNDSVQCLDYDPTLGLWVGTLGGLTRVPEVTGPSESYIHDPLNRYSISQNWVNALLIDSIGLVWIGTRISGLNRFDPATQQFRSYRAEPDQPNRLHNNRVRAIEEADAKGLWVSIFGSGLRRFDLDSGNFELPRDMSGNIPDFDTSLFVCLENDGSKGLWLGSYDSGVHYWDRETGEVRTFQMESSGEGGLGSNHILTMYLSKADQLWIGTMGGGLSMVDLSSQSWSRFTHHPEDPRSLAANSVQAVYEDRYGILWVGTRGGGLSQLDYATGTFVNYRFNPQDSSSISHNSIATIFEASNGDLWVGTQGGGICKVLRNREDVSPVKFKTYSTLQGLAADAIGGFVEDRKGELWISTISGVSHFDPVTERFQNFEGKDGVQTDGYYIDSVFKDSEEVAYFGGLEGLTVFDPNTIRRRNFSAPMVLTDFLLNNQSVQVRSMDELSPLEAPIEETQQIVLKHTQKVFAFEFAALHFSGSRETRYAYQLEGFDADWVISDANKRFAAYTNLSAGDYLFRVKAGNRNGDWYPDQATVGIRILPPPWMTWWAYSLYGLLILGSLGAYFYYHEKRIAAQRAINERLTLMDTLKDEFLANTSHELRTPLNGIIGLSESLIDGAGGVLAPKVKHDLTMVSASARRLSHLVNDILDFTKLKNRDIVLHPKHVDLHALADITLEMHRPLVSDRPIELRNRIPKALPTVSGDENRILQILHNLVGNAVKFTESGMVEISAERHDSWIEVSVTDTGPGVPEAKREQIFGAFEQLEGGQTRQQGGTGLGLAITRRLVELHGGKIWVNGADGAGARFTFELPVAGENLLPKGVSLVEAVEREEPEVVDISFKVTEPSVGRSGKGYTILVVDDDTVNRQVLVNLLALQNYQIVEATCGADALQIIKTNPRIKLVLLDLMMPKMSGYEVCKKLRETHKVNELPVIFLTAKDQLADLVTAFEAGANDYLTKPISKPELLSRVKIHLQLSDIHGHLEEKVGERTSELNALNRQLRSNHREFEALDHLVKAINRETAIFPMAETLVAEGLSVFSDAHTSAFLMRKGDEDCFTIMAWRGFDTPNIPELHFTQEELEKRYLGGKPLTEDVWLLRNIRERHRPNKLSAFPHPEVLMALTVRFGGRLECVFVLSNLDNQAAFSDLDVAKFQRFREHLVSAISKAKYVQDLEATTRDLRTAQDDLLRAAHQAGMTEIVINVLHEIGNTLNHINTSADVLSVMANSTILQRILRKVVQMVEDNSQNLSHFLENDPNGQKIPLLLGEIEASIIAHSHEMREEVRELKDGILRIMGILQAQHEIAEGDGLMESVEINSFLDSCIKHLSAARSFFTFQVARAFQPVPAVDLLKRKTAQVITHLMVNAQEAFVRNQVAHPTMTLITEHREGEVLVRVRDNAGGIHPEDCKRVFSQGFTTKAEGHGLGLHFCANAMTEMGGRIQLESADGETQVTLIFPVRVKVEV